MTSDERREVAERVRKTHGIMAFVDALGIDPDGDWCWTDVSRRVADLIDPTCHIETSGEWHGSPVDSVCSECLSPLYRGMRYCTYCGCRVVTDDGRD